MGTIGASDAAGFSFALVAAIDFSTDAATVGARSGLAAATFGFSLTGLVP